MEEKAPNPAIKLSCAPLGVDLTNVTRAYYFPDSYKQQLKSVETRLFACKNVYTRQQRLLISKAINKIVKSINVAARDWVPSMSHEEYINQHKKKKEYLDDLEH